MKQLVIVGGGFAGLNAARKLGAVAGLQVTVIDRENHHLFQPLLYQVAMAALSPADIAVPIRSLLTARNTRIIKALVRRIDVAARCVVTDYGNFYYDCLLVACGARYRGKRRGGRDRQGKHRGIHGIVGRRRACLRSRQDTQCRSRCGRPSHGQR